MTESDIEAWEEAVRTGEAIAEDGLPILIDEWLNTTRRFPQPEDKSSHLKMAD